MFPPIASPEPERKAIARRRTRDGKSAALPGQASAPPARLVELAETLPLLYGKGMRGACFVLLWLVAGCGYRMPSDRPLGLGPTAKEDQALAAVRERTERQRKLREHRAEQEQAARQASEQETDAGAEAPEPQASAEADAGTADAADSVDSADAAPNVVFEGEYLGEDAVTVKVPGLPETSQRDSKAKTRVERRDAAHIVLVLIDSSRDTPLCRLDAKTQDNRAIVVPGQPCFAEAAGGGPVVVEVSEGTAVVTGTHLELDLVIALRVEVGDDSLRGSIVYHFDGERQ